MDESSPIDSSQNSSNLNNNSGSLGKSSGDHSTNSGFDVLFDTNLGASKSVAGSSKSVVDLKASKKSDLLIISEQDEELNNSVSDEINVHGSTYNNMLQIPEDHKRTKYVQKALKKSEQKDNMGGKEPLKQDIGSDEDINHNDGTILRNSGLSSIASTTGSEVDLNKTLLNSEQGSLSLQHSTFAQEERPQPSSNSRGFFSSWFGLSSSTNKIQGTPEYYVDRLLQKNVSSKSLADRLQSLRVTLTTAKLSWIKSFIDGNGLAALEYILERYTTGARRILLRNSDHDDRIQSECMRCLRVLLNTEVV